MAICNDNLTITDNLKINDLILLLSSMDPVFRIMQNVQEKFYMWNITCVYILLKKFVLIP